MMKFTILVVDDEKSYCEVMEQILNLRDFQVHTAHDAEEALAILEQCHTDLILLDVMLPNVNGFQLARMLRSDPCFADIPIVIVTAKATPEDHHEAIRAGAVGYLSKPFTIDELFKTINPFVPASAFTGCQEKVSLR
jgi:CheY-like chemotaxis protein